MAAGILPKPGSKAGPCRKACDHKDCNQTRDDASSGCRFCAEPIGYGRSFYRSRFDGAPWLTKRASLKPST